MTDSTLQSQIQSDMVAAMREKDSLRLGTIRLLRAAIKQIEIDQQTTLDDDAVLTVINKMVKQRRDSIEQFNKAGRTELAEKEQSEIDILHTYLPEQLSEAEIEAAVKAAIEETGASSMKDMGKLMGILKPKLTGRADMSQVSQKIKALLT